LGESKVTACKKIIASEESSRKKEYIITSSGEDALMREYSRLRELVMITESILEG